MKEGALQKGPHLEFCIKVGVGGQGPLHHVWSEREVLWQLPAPLDHPGVGTVQALVAKEPVLLPVVHAVLW